MAKKSERKKLTEKLDGLCRDVVRLRDDNKCQRCSKTIEGRNSHPCHVIVKGSGASQRRFDLLNIFLGCYPCHRWFDHNKTASWTWFAEKWPARAEWVNLMYRGGKPAPIKTEQMKELVEVLEQKRDQLQKEK